MRQRLNIYIGIGLIAALLTCWAYAAPGWTERHSDAAAGAVRNIFFVDDATGWISTGAAEVLTTTDGGDNWRRLVVAENSRIYALHFTTRERGWAAGDLEENDGNLYPVIYTTRNGGQTWEIQKFFAAWHGGIFTLRFADARHGWAIGQVVPCEGGAGLAFYTTDGGDTWLEMPQPPWGRDFLWDIFFADPQRGWALADNGKGIFYTADGGQSWSRAPINSAKAAFLRRVVFAGDAQTGWVIGGRGAALQTTDGGRTWIEKPLPTNEWLSDVMFFNQSQGWISAEDGTLLTTDDGGYSWEAEQPRPNFPLRALGLTRNRIFLGGDAGRLLVAPYSVHRP